MAKIIRLNTDCPDRTVCPEPFDLDKEFIFSLGPEAQVPAETDAIPTPDAVSKPAARWPWPWSAFRRP